MTSIPHGLRVLLETTLLLQEGGRGGSGGQASITSVGSVFSEFFFDTEELIVPDGKDERGRGDHEIHIN
jgi:hypothetical protein